MKAGNFAGATIAFALSVLTGCSEYAAEPSPAEAKAEAAALAEKCRNLVLTKNAEVDEARKAAKNIDSGKYVDETSERHGKIEFVEPAPKLDEGPGDTTQELEQECRIAGLIRDKR